MDCVINTSILILNKVGEYTVARVGRQLGYLTSYEGNFEDLRTQISQLNHAKNRLQHAVIEATQEALVIEEDVQEWLSKACRIVSEAEEFVLREGEANLGHCNIKLRYQLSRKAKKMVEIMLQMKDQVARFPKVSYHLPPQSNFNRKLYKDFESRKKILTGVIEALRDPKLSMILVHGMSGIGKTMLAEEVGRRTLKEKLFSKVIMVSVSQNFDVEKVQEQITKRLGLKLTEMSPATRADLIQQRLKQEKEILLILDNVWKKFNLAEVGISFDDDQKRCKILVTSRLRVLFDDHVDTTKTFDVGLLSDCEARDLFNRIVGNSVLEQPDFQDLAPQIVKACGRLPIIITTVASALRNKELFVWEDALRQLKSFIITDIEGMEANYRSIKLSYDALTSEEEKWLLLLSSLREEDCISSMAFLLRYAIGLGMFPGSYKLEETRDKVYTLISDLQDRSLLLNEFYYVHCVKAHDMVRYFALSIAPVERKMFHIRNSVALKDMISRNSLKDSVAIFLFGDRDEQLPEKLECPSLQFLFFMRNSIPDRFLEETRDLKVLDLTSVGLMEKIPTSICALQNLHTLCVWDCQQLRDIALIGELKNLELLTVANSGIEKVPKQIGQLTRLRLLDFNNCSRLRIIEPNVIAKLTKLEELNLEHDGNIEWESEGVLDGDSRNASLTEIKNLVHLKAFYLQVDDARVLPKDLFSENLERYGILVGNRFDDDDLEKYKFRAKRMLQLRHSRSQLLKEQGLAMLLKKSEILYLDGLEGVDNFVRDLGAEGFQKLKCLVLQNSHEIQYIVNWRSYPSSAFRRLELMRLRSLTGLETLFHGELTPESFRRLQVLEVSNCDKLRNLFSLSTAKCLLQLETIKVSHCETVEEIVINERRTICSEIILPQLSSLRLKNVPRLSQYAASLEPPKTVFIPLFSAKLADPTSFLNLRELFVEDSCSIKYLFSSSVAENLVQLNRLEIRNCSMLEEIITMDQQLRNISLPQLYYVMLEDLPMLKRFCSGAVVEFPLYAEITFEGCPNFRNSIAEYKYLS